MVITDLVIPKPHEKQLEFFKAKEIRVAYGGARGGGKSWAARVKASLLCLRYEGIQILLLRRTFPELRENHIIPLQKMLRGIAIYKETSHDFTFPNGSRIVLGYCKSESDVLQYQGQAYDVIFMEEATQFTEFQYQTLTEISRSSGMMNEKFKPRIYLTCNPGGIGHSWVKRLFIDRQYKNSEKAEDYRFIKSTVYDNPTLLENSPDYVRTLENLPPDRRKAMLEGSWDVFEGAYFPEFDREVHTCDSFQIPENWRRYFVMDYGMDMTAGYFIAIDEAGRAFVYKELYKPGLIISRAVEEIKAIQNGDKIYQYIAPPDMWNRRQDTGKSVADIFGEHGIYLTKARNDRVQGWYALKEWLRVGIDEYGKKSAAIKIFRNCSNLIRCLPLVQYDDKNPNDVAKNPHELTHAPDALRYFVAGCPAPEVVITNERFQLPWELRTDTEENENGLYMEW